MPRGRKKDTINSLREDKKLIQYEKQLMENDREYLMKKIDDLEKSAADLDAKILKNKIFLASIVGISESMKGERTGDPTKRDLAKLFNACADDARKIIKE